MTLLRINILYTNPVSIDNKFNKDKWLLPRVEAKNYASFNSKFLNI